MDKDRPYIIEIFGTYEEYVASLDGSYSGGASVCVRNKYDAKQVANVLIEAGATLVIHKAVEE